MLSDITGRTVEVVDRPQDVGAVGAAAVIGVGLSVIPSLKEAGAFIPAQKTFTPDCEAHKLYEKNYKVFLKLHDANRKLFYVLNH